MDKTQVYKALKTVFYLCGFPLLTAVMFFMLLPMLGEEVMGDSAVIWVVVFAVIWIAVEGIRLILNKFVGSKGENQRKLVMVIVAAIAIFAIMLPSTIADAVYKDKYNTAKAEYEQEYGDLGLLDYNKLIGRNSDYTDAFKSEVNELIKATYVFMDKYNITAGVFEGGVYGNATDAELNQGIGKQYSVADKAAALLDAKKNALAKVNEYNDLVAQQTELNAIIDGKTEATPEQKTEAEAKLPEVNEKLEGFKGLVINLTDDMQTNLAALIDNIIPRLATVFPGLEDKVLVIGGLELQVKAITNLVEWLINDSSMSGMIKSLIGLDADKHADWDEIIDALVKFIAKDGSVGEMLVSEIAPDGMLDLGMTNNSVSYYQGMVDGSDTDMSLTDVAAYQFKLNNYPDALAASMMSRISKLMVGVVVLSMFLTEYFNKKQKEAQGGAEK